MSLIGPVTGITSVLSGTAASAVTGASLPRSSIAPVNQVVMPRREFCMNVPAVGYTWRPHESHA